MLVMEALTDKEKGYNRQRIRDRRDRLLSGTQSGEDFSPAALIDDEVGEDMQKERGSKPLHKPANLNCIDSCRKLMPKRTQCGCVRYGFPLDDARLRIYVRHRLRGLQEV